MEALLGADHMCCVCRAPAADLQIHHIDEDPSNNDASNLAVLCLGHHSQAHTRGGFGRQLDARLISHHRATWAMGVQHRREVAAGGPHSRGPLRLYLGNLLTIDFSWDGPFRGEFGEFTALEDEEYFQLAGRESIDTKPRLFHTYWGLVGSKALTPELFAEQAASASRRLADRLDAGGWVETDIRDYQASPVEGVRRVRSVRHTAKAASILLLTEGNDALAAELVWRLVESAGEFMNGDGGCREELLDQSSSLYASAYVLQLLSLTLADPRAPGFVPEFDGWVARAEDLLALLQTYMARSWEESRWHWRDIPWQVNAPYIVADAGPWIGSGLREEIRLSFRDELTPGGRLRDPDAGSEFGAPEALRALRTAQALRCLSDWEQLADGRFQGLCEWLLTQDWALVRLRPCDVSFLSLLLPNPEPS